MKKKKKRKRKETNKEEKKTQPLLALLDLIKEINTGAEAARRRDGGKLLAAAVSFLV